MRFAAALFVCLAPLAAQAPITQRELADLLRAIEASRPSEEIIEIIQKRTVDFDMTPAVRSELQAAATRRPPDLVRAVLDNATFYGPAARLRQHALGAGSADPGQRAASLGALSAFLRDRGALPRGTSTEGWPEPALALVAPPNEPPKPPFPDQQWRRPQTGVAPAPLDYDPAAVRGAVDLDLSVDGRVMIVLKHQTLFYNAICGDDLEVRTAAFSQPLPRVPLDQIKFVVEPQGKPRGAVFACPSDARCRKTDRNCAWTDLAEVNDDRGYPAVRFVVDDSQRGRGSYKVTLRWTLEPMRFEDVAVLLKRAAADTVAAHVRSRGATFTLDAAQEQDLRRLGANDRVLAAIRGNQRRAPSLR